MSDLYSCEETFHKETGCNTMTQSQMKAVIGLIHTSALILVPLPCRCAYNRLCSYLSPSPSGFPLVGTMLINQPESPSSSGPGQSQAISCDENLPAEERRNEAVDKHMKLPDSQEQKAEQEHVPANALSGSANAASSKKIFGTIRKPNPTVKKGEKTRSCCLFVFHEAINRK